MPGKGDNLRSPYTSESKWAADIPCLQCGKVFRSPDRRRIRRCNKCKKGKRFGSPRTTAQNTQPHGGVKSGN